MPSRIGSYDAVVFDLLTALLDSWTLWISVAGSERAGLAWRKRYLDITYGCGVYRPYEVLVKEAAVAAGFPASWGDELEQRWLELEPWDDVRDVLAVLSKTVPLAIATNCSERLGRMAADRTGAHFAVIMTAESAGYYKPRPEVYRAVLTKLGTRPVHTLFVAGSASDVPGAKGVGMPVYWHNRIGLPPRDDARPDRLETTLSPLVAHVEAGLQGVALRS